MNADITKHVRVILRNKSNQFLAIVRKYDEHFTPANSIGLVTLYAPGGQFIDNTEDSKGSVAESIQNHLAKQVGIVLPPSTELRFLGVHTIEISYNNVHQFAYYQVPGLCWEVPKNLCDAISVGWVSPAYAYERAKNTDNDMWALDYGLEETIRQCFGAYPKELSHQIAPANETKKSDISLPY